MPHPHILLFELYAGGHQGLFVRQLLSYWIEHDVQGQLDLVLSGQFLSKYPSVSELAARQGGRNVRIIRIEETVQVQRSRPFQALRAHFEHGRLLHRYASRLRPDHCLFMYLDHALLPLVTNLRFGFPVSLAGLYFRATLHAHLYDETPPHPEERVKRFAKALLLKAALRNPHFKTLFCLDPYAVPYAARLTDAARVVALPDGVELLDNGMTRTEMHARWKVEPGRKAGLLFGVLNSRKGLFRLLEAMPLLPEGAQRRFCLILAGRIQDSERTQALALLDQVRQTTRVQVVLDDRFVDDDEIQAMVRASDLVLLPYQQHVGSSNVLVRAATAQKPVLGSDYGLVGRHIRVRRLGRAVDSTSPQAIAEAVHDFLADPSSFGFAADEAARFASENTAERYAEAVFSALGAL